MSAGGAGAGAAAAVARRGGARGLRGQVRRGGGAAAGAGGAAAHQARPHRGQDQPGEGALRQGRQPEVTAHYTTQDICRVHIDDVDILTL